MSKVQEMQEESRIYQGKVIAPVSGTPQWTLGAVSEGGIVTLYTADGKEVTDQRDKGLWCDLKTAVEAVRKKGYDGICFMPEDRTFVEIYLPKSVHSGKPEPYAQELLDKTGCYAEVSRKGGMLHIITAAYKDTPDIEEESVVIRTTPRFISVTGRVLGEIKPITACDGVILPLCRALMRPSPMDSIPGDDSWMEDIPAPGDDCAPPAGEEEQTETEGKLLPVISGAELAKKEIPPVKWVVRGMLPQGLSMLVGPSKFGKSWMALDICLCVAAGKPFMGWETEKSGVLYLALEDTEGRAKERMLKVLGGAPVPEGFYLSLTAPGLGNGLDETLERQLKALPDVRFVVIDTFQKVRGGAKYGENAYAADYRETGILKRLADRLGISLLLIHHTRKMQDASDAFNRISGTNGLMGAADTILLMERKNRDDTETVLRLTGRDIESADLGLTFDKESCRWQYIGDMRELERRRSLEEERQAYEDDQIVGAIRALLRDAPTGWKGTAKELYKQLSGYGWTPDCSLKGLHKRLAALETGLKQFDGIGYRQEPQLSCTVYYLYFFPQK